MQLSIIEFTKNVLKMKNSGSSEFGKHTNNVISLMTEWSKKIKRLQEQKKMT